MPAENRTRDVAVTTYIRRSSPEALQYKGPAAAGPFFIRSAQPVPNAIAAVDCG